MSAASIHAEVTPADTSGRCPLLFLLGSAVSWLVVSGALALIASIQLHSPHFLENCAWLTHGRVQALRETAFVYGWLGNAGIAIVLWVLARVGSAQLRALNWIGVGALFWNIGLTAGLVGISLGHMTSFSMLQLPGYVQLLMTFAYASMAVAGVLAWSDRRHDELYVSQWYAVAALFLFPWVLTAAQLMLVWAPVRGVVQAVTAAWYGQSLISLWLSPIALAAAYYIVPKVTGRAMPSYKMFAVLGFWTLLFAGPFVGARHFVTGPVPAWIATLGLAAAWTVIFHFLVIVLNLRGVLGGAGTSLKFMAYGLTFYVVGGVLDCFVLFRSVARESQFTLVTTALDQIMLYGAISMIFFGAIYYLLPRVTGRAWASGGLVSGHRLLMQVGIVLLVGSLFLAGRAQGEGLADASMSFTDIAGHMKTWLLLGTAANAVLLLGNVLLFVNFLRTACPFTPAAATSDTLFRQPSTMEAPAS